MFPLRYPAMAMSPSAAASIPQAPLAKGKGWWAVITTLALLLTVYALDAKRRADGPQWITATPAQASAEQQAEAPQPLPRPVATPQARPVGATTAPAGEPMVPIADALPGNGTGLLPRLTAGESPEAAAAAMPAPVASGSALAVVRGDSDAAMAFVGEADIPPADTLSQHQASAATAPVPATVGTALLADGQRGLDEALRGGLIRPAGSDDLRRWAAARAGQPDASAGLLQVPSALQSRTFVIERGFQWPGGMQQLGAMVFLVEAGVPYPRGDAGQSAVLDMSTGACRGALCSSLIQMR